MPSVGGGIQWLGQAMGSKVVGTVILCASACVTASLTYTPNEPRYHTAVIICIHDQLHSILLPVTSMSRAKVLSCKGQDC